MTDSNNSTLIIAGVSLVTHGATEFNAELKTTNIDAWIGESKRSAGAIAKRLGGETVTTANLFFLDHGNPIELDAIYRKLCDIAKSGGTAVLFSDNGMPCFFDPGNEVLNWARKLGMKIRTQPGPTSWSTAVCVSGFAPPILVYGFLPQKTDDRKKEIRSLQKHSCPIVLMDTPYRFETLVQELHEFFPKDRACFVAFEIATSFEEYWWGTLRELHAIQKRTPSQKKRFVLILGKH